MLVTQSKRLFKRTSLTSKRERGHLGNDLLRFPKFLLPHLNVVTKRRNDLQWATMSCNDLQWATMSYNDQPQWPTMSYNELQRPTMSYNDLQWATMSYNDQPQWPTKSYNELKLARRS